MATTAEKVEGDPPVLRGDDVPAPVSADSTWSCAIRFASFHRFSKTPDSRMRVAACSVKPRMPTLSGPARNGPLRQRLAGLLLDVDVLEQRLGDVRRGGGMIAGLEASGDRLDVAIRVQDLVAPRSR